MNKIKLTFGLLLFAIGTLAATSLLDSSDNQIDNDKQQAVKKNCITPRNG